ncbi:maleylacetoacetate isomerase [Rhizobium oryzicola]|uniref:Maleylacetoacetate isomerase n=1 Tax=Rhizobium oryzicola TaxID=1232668 RepID=A0ABT8T448_9HYPH|nr:maleylacetoacetate isomerase [Rhizobium oryzicola]MDO1585432.1 maleylacetoacetate isomerase [Rhizobium oryzicola]
MQLYTFWRSNAAFRVRVALALKKLAVEEIEVDILSGKQFDPDYADVNAGHAVPAFVHDGNVMFQSLAIIEYLDDIQTEPRLIPADAKERAYARALALVAAADAHPLVVPRVRKYLTTQLGANDATVKSWCSHWASEGIATYERLLTRRPPTPFALGETPSIADICIAGQIVTADLYKQDLSAFPRVEALGKRCFDLPEFAAAHPFQHPDYREI